MYLLSWETPVLGGKLHSPHNLEIPFVFHDVTTRSTPILVTEGTAKAPGRMAGAWVAFAYSGNPNHSGLPRWNSYNADTRGTMVFDDECKVVNDPGGAERAALEALRSGESIRGPNV